MKHVLLIEPDIGLAQVYVQALELAGYHVAHVISAQAAIGAADAQAPHAIVLELQLPVHGGIEFLYEFRSYPEWQHIPVIINSHIPPEEFVPVQPVLRDELGVRVCYYKPRTSLQQLLRSVAELAV